MYPVLFRIGSFPISLYGVMIALGLIVAVYLGVRLGKKVGFKEEVVIDIIFYSVIAGMVGARILYIIVNFKDFLNEPLFYIFNRRGFVLWGGILGAAPMVYFMIKKKRLPLGKSVDIGAIGLVLAQAFGRIGCFFAGCCYGKVTKSFLGIRFPRFLYPNIDMSNMSETELYNVIATNKVSFEGSPAFQYHYDEGWVKLTDTHSLPVYPTQLFHSISNFIIFGILFYVYVYKKKFDGQVFALYLILYSIMRFTIEFFRGDVERGFYWGFISTSQIICIFTFLLGLWTYKKFSSKIKLSENK